MANKNIPFLVAHFAYLVLYNSPAVVLGECSSNPAIKAVTWKQVEQICAKLNGLNIYDPTAVADILKIEDCNFDRAEIQQQLYGLAVSAKRYVVYAKEKNKTRIIKPREHGLGIVYVPDKRKRYKPDDCKDRQNDYARLSLPKTPSVHDHPLPE